MTKTLHKPSVDCEVGLAGRADAGVDRVEDCVGRAENAAGCEVELGLYGLIFSASVSIWSHPPIHPTYLPSNNKCRYQQ